MTKPLGEEKGDGNEEKGKLEKILYVLRAASDSQLLACARAAFVYVQS